MSADEQYDTEIFNRTMIALAASAAASQVASAEMELIPLDQAELVATGGEFFMPAVVLEGVDTGDSRNFRVGSIECRDLPLPVTWQIATGQAHDGSVVVGRIDSIERLDGDLNGWGNARGVFDTGPYGQEAERLVRGGFLRGVSASMDQFEADVIGDDGDDEHEDRATDELADESESKNVKSTIKSDPIDVKHARIMGVTLLPMPALQECSIMMADEAAISEEDSVLLDGLYEEELSEPEVADVMLSALAAGAAPVKPPRDWFDDPKLSGPTPITVTDDGHVYGHIASWNMNHIGMAGNIRAPRSSTNYAYFRTGVVRCETGEDVPVGQLTLSGGHAPLTADAESAVRHYDDTASAVADVAAGEDRHGIWVSGALRPGVTAEQVRVLRASPPSGDWRPINGRLELVAVCQVNVPGFPVARAMVASGAITALVAAGARDIAMLRDRPIDDLRQRVETLEQKELSVVASAARSRVASLAERRANALSAAAKSARDRLDAARRDRNNALTASAAEARARVAALRVQPDWDETAHPRDDEGKFREIIGRLSDLLTGVDGATDATDKVAAAADLEDGGNVEAAKNAGREARARLTELEDTVTDPATRDRLREAESVLDSVISAGVDSVSEWMSSEDASKFGQAIVEWIMAEVVEKVDPTQAIRTAPKELRRYLDGREFQDAQELESYLNMLLSRMMSPVA